MFDRAFSELHEQLKKTAKKSGDGYRGRGQWDEAIASYTQALDIDPEYVAALVNRGVCYQATKKFAEAIADFTRALTIAPKLMVAYNNRALAYSDQGEFDKSVSDYKKALEISPKDKKVYYNRAAFYADHGKLAEGISDIIEILKIDPSFVKDEANFLLVIEYYLNVIKHGDVDKIAKNDLFKAIKMLSQEEQIPLLKACLDKTTVLGDRFWKQEGFKPCSLTSGMLKQIYNHLKTFEPDYSVPVIDGSEANYTPLLYFNDHTARKASYRDLNLDRDQEKNWGFNL